MKTKHNDSDRALNGKIGAIQFPYKQTIEMQMASFYNWLSEKDKRLYAGNETFKLEHGGISYIATILNCDRKTIYKGLSKLKNPDVIEKDRIRAKGGGRKKSIDRIPHIDENFLCILRDYTAGDPMDEKIRWTNLTLQQIADKLKETGIEVSKKIVKQLFKRHGYTKRKAEKSLSTGQSKDRNEQFKILSKIRKEYEIAGNPIISMDTKKKELLGNLYRDGMLYTLDVQKIFDHDFPHLADGIIIPHGLYDVLKNKACVNIGTSKDTKTSIIFLKKICKSLQMRLV